MKKIILTTITTMVLVLGFAGATNPTVIQPLRDLPYSEY